MKVIVVIPAYNEARRIAAVIAGALLHADTVLVVDDGSTDATAQVAADAGAQVIAHIENCGPGAATMTGIRAARAMGAGAVVTLDADEQHDPNDMPAMLGPIADGTADIVFANRFGRRNRIPPVRRFFNAAGNVLTFASTGRWVPDSQCGYKEFGHRALAEVDLRMSGFEFCTEIVRECVQRQWRIAHVPVKVLYSQYTLAKGQSFAVGVRTACKILLRSFLR